MFVLAHALFNHIYLVMTFRHDGRNLPMERTPAFWLLIFCCVVTYLLRAAVAGVPLDSGLLGVTAGLALLFVLLRAPVMAAHCLASSGSELVTAAAILAGVSPTSSGLLSMMFIWRTIAFAVLVIRILKLKK